MAEVITNTQRMTGSFAGVTTEAKYTIDNAKAKITIIDNEKIAFDEALKNIDQDLLTTIEETNDTLKEVKKQYDLRVTDQGCRSDLFWRVTGITTFTQTQNTGGGAGSQSTKTQLELTCTRLAASYPKIQNGFDDPTICDPNFVPSPEQPTQTGCLEGLPGSWIEYNPDVMMYYAGAGTTMPDIQNINMGNGDDLSSAGSAFDAYLLPDNLHGLKLYREPYDRDVFDLAVFSGIGTIAPGSRDIHLLTTNVNTGIKKGDIVTTEGGNTPFAGLSGNIVTGIGSTAKDLSGYSDIVNVSSGSTTLSVIPVITVEDPAVGEAQAPNKDGEYTTFDFSQNPNDISDSYALPVDKNPYVPQEISIMKFSEKGAGVKIKYNNNGQPTSKQDWNQFLEGFPDPDQLPDNIVEVKEPKVGAGKIYYVIGFPQKPVLPTGGDASEGTVVLIDESSTTDNLGNDIGSWPGLYQSLSSCNNNDLNDALSERDDAESKLAGDNDFPKKISLGNKIRKKRDELNLSIWAYRTHIGDSDDRIQSADEFNDTINDSEYQDLMNGTN